MSKVIFYFDQLSTVYIIFKVPRVTLDCQDFQVRRDSLDCQGYQEQRVVQVHRVYRELMEQEDRMVMMMFISATNLNILLVLPVHILHVCSYACKEMIAVTI